MHPEDAEKLGIRQDDSVRFSTPKGSIVVQANLMLMVQPGVVQMYHASRNALCMDQNDLAIEGGLAVGEYARDNYV